MELEELRVLITAETKGLRNELNNLQGQLKRTESQANKVTNSIKNTFSKVGKVVAGAFAVTKVVEFGKKCVDTANETENAWRGLNSIVVGTGKSWEQATSYLKKYVSDGLVPMNDAVLAYKNLASRGYNADQIESVMEAFKNSAIYGRQSGKSIGEAISSATEGLKNENSTLVDNVGVTKNVAKMWEEYAKSIGKTTNQLTQQEKIQAEVAGIIEATKFQMNDASNYMNTYAGRMARLSASFTNLKAKIGGVVKVFASIFIPIVQACIDVITKFVDKIIRLLASFGVQVDVLDQLAGSSEATFGGMADSAGDATDGVKELNKEINRLQGFDEINLLGKDTTDALNSGTGNIGGSTIDPNDMIPTGSIEADVKLNPVVDLSDVMRYIKTKFNDFKTYLIVDVIGLKNYEFIMEQLKSIKDYFIGLKDDFLRGLWIGLGGTEEIKKSLDRIKEHLGNLAGDVISIFAGIFGNINKSFNKLAEFLGKKIGSLGSIFSSLGELIIGGLDKAFEGFRNLDLNVGLGDTFLSGYFNTGDNPITSYMNAIEENYNEIARSGIGIKNMDVTKQFIDGIAGDNKLKDIKKYSVNVRSQMINLLRESFDVTGEIYDIAGKLATSIADLFEVFRSDSAKTVMGDWLGSIILGFENIVVLIKKVGRDALGLIVKPFTDNIGIIKEAFQGFMDSMSNLSFAVLYFVDNIGKTIQSVYDEYFKPFFDKLANGLSSIVKTLTEAYQQYFAPIVEWVTEAVVQLVADYLVPLIQKVITWIGKVVEVIGIIWDKAIAPLVNLLIKVLAPVVSSVLKGIIGVVYDIVATIMAVAGNIMDVVNGVMDIIIGIFTLDGDKILSGIGDICEGLVGVVTNLFIWFGSMPSHIFGIFKDLISMVWDLIKSGLEEVWNFISSIFQSIWNTIKSVCETIWNFLKPILETIGNFFKTVWNAILNTIKTVLNAIWNVIKTVWNGISNTVKSVMNGISSVIRNIWNGVCSVLGNTLRNLGNLFSSIFGGIKNTVSNVFDGIKNIFNGIINFVTGVFTGAWDKAWKGVIQIFSGIWDTLSGIVKGAFNLVIDAINWVIEQINDALTFTAPDWGFLPDSRILLSLKLFNCWELLTHNGEDNQQGSSIMENLQRPVERRRIKRFEMGAMQLCIKIWSNLYRNI